MHAMFVWEFPPVDVDLVFARQSSACAFIRFEDTELTSPQRFAAQLESRPGQPFDSAKAERDARRLTLR